ncbi:hypothetical protein DFJ58DRAFT_781009 [Suillus subalutaceus]|uniref:uncharacterized protein n=1 Tax=Suillus subalutaceus TaxID=48586 RepID=UPI001B869131|nr:uncharacterized protein DFJ58DRAFT_802049 [Suillus subalutaceus]XP_041245269.1 uncharacterized protein DFJ58DRAFT_781009 [Suillus subalutaceus]KAG1844840.1 hypothetical protein DFJ58DRAFT_802049 [Suillus subalutaceus]KAG1858960.1 hypothetical protein DFJ58DRAFT_781009 [Suillus subalutaceus]
MADSGTVNGENENLFTNLDDLALGEPEIEQQLEPEDEDSEVEDDDDAVLETEGNVEDGDDSFDISLLVPIEGVVDTMVISSNTSWGYFCLQLANAMLTPLESLNIAYKFSTDAKADPPRALSMAKHLLVLIQGAGTILCDEQRVRRLKKPFMVIIVDRSENSKADEVAKGKAGLGKGKVITSMNQSREA